MLIQPPGKKPGQLEDVYFDIEINGTKAGRLIFQLFDYKVPITCKNFRTLATGQLGFGYRNSIIHKVIPEFTFQGGDLTRQDGMGGRSIYGQKFKDQNFLIRHQQPYLLSMGNIGSNTNTSQFYCSYMATQWLHHSHVVFGRIRSGHEVAKKIQKQGTNMGDIRNGGRIVITDCGIIPDKEEQK